MKYKQRLKAKVLAPKSNPAYWGFLLLAAAACLLCSTSSNALPIGGVSGTSSISTPSANTMQINQSTNKSVINWQSYNIGSGEKVIYHQPNASSISLNRVTGSPNPSQIYGSISANGQIWIINPAGIFFGPSAHVNVGGLLATTGQISDRNFMAGNYQFLNASALHGQVINQGTIIAAEHGLVALVGSQVTNNGMIQAKLGHVILGAGDAYTVSFDPSGMINFTIDRGAVHAKITNNGMIAANGGQVLISAQSASNTLDNVVNVKGIIQVKSVGVHNGELIVSGGSNGMVKVAARIHANGSSVSISGNKVQFSGSMAAGNVTMAANDSLTIGGAVKTDGGTISLSANNMLTINNQGSVASHGGAVNYAADNMVLAGNTNSGSGLVTITPASESTAIQLGDGAANGPETLGLSNSELATIYSTGGLTIGGSRFTAGLTVVGPASPVNVTGGTLTFIDSGAIAINSVVTSKVNVAVISTANNITFGNGGMINASGSGVTLSAPQGSVTGNNSNSTDVTANYLSINAARGIGTSNVAITSAVSNFWGSNTSSGDINVMNTGTLIVSGISNTSGGNVQLVDNSNTTVNGAINTTGSGNIILNANGLILNSNLNSGTTGMVKLTSGSTISQTGGSISSSYVDVDSVSTATLAAANVIAAIAASISGVGAGNNFIFTDTPPPAIFNNTLSVYTVSNASSNGIISITSNGNISSSQSITNLGSGTIVLSAAQGTINVSGNIISHAGTINVLGNTIVIAPSAVLSANAQQNGNGGDIAVLASESNTVAGTLIARGGALSGNGGLIETSSYNLMDLNGIHVDTSAPYGQTGTWLLDPRDITVITGGTATLVQVSTFSNSPTTDFTIDPATINSAAANVVLQAMSDVTITNAIAMTGSGLTLTIDAGRNIFVNANISTNNGAVTLDANDSASGATLAERQSATAGGITMSSGVTINAGTALVSLTVDPSATSPFSPGTITTSGITTTGNVTLSDTASSISQVSGSVIHGALLTTSTGTGAVLTNANTVTSFNAANATSGTISLTNTAATLTITGITNVTGNIAVNNTGSVTSSGVISTTNTGTINLTASGAETIGGNITSAGGAVTLSSGGIVLESGANKINTGGGLLSLTSVGGATLTNANVVGSFNATNTASGNISFTNGSALSITGISQAVGNLTITNTGAITQTAGITVSGNSSFAAGAAAITLSNAANNFTGTVAFSNTGANTVSITNSAPLSLAASSLTTGALTLVSGGSITQTGAIIESAAAGVITLSSTVSGANIILNTQANNLSGAVTFGGTLGNISEFLYRDINASAPVPTNLASVTNLGNLTLEYDNAAIAIPAATLTGSGNLVIIAGGAITQSGALVVPGTSSFTTTAFPITLGTVTNNFTGAVSLNNSGNNNVVLASSAAVVMGTSSVGTGTFTVSAGGSITETGAFTQASGAGLATFGSTAASSSITLSNTGNSFGTFAIGGINININNINIYNTSSSAALPSTLLALTNLANLTLDFTNAGIVIPITTLTSGNLTVTANGAVSESGQIIVPGTTTVTTGSFPVSLSTTNNIMSGVVTVTNTGANNVSIVDNSALLLGNINVGNGTLTINSTGIVSQSAATTITQASGAGLASFTSLGGLALTNNNTLYQFSENNLIGGNISLTNTSSSLAIGTITNTGGASITVNQTGNLSSSGSISTSANGSISLLATGTNTLSGAINTNGSGAATFSGSTINLGTNITTSGGTINFNNPVVLTSNAVVNSGAANITFSGTLDGNFSPTLSSSGLLSLDGIVGGTTPLASLTITATGGTTDIGGNVTTAGAQNYGNPVVLTGSSNFTSNSNSITIGAGVSWSGAFTLNLNANQNIIINGGISASSGTLNVSAQQAAQSITTGSNGSINVANFNLLQGFWYQSGSLPGFSVSNNFQINSGTIPTSTAEFFRVAGGAGTSGSPYQIADIYGLQGIESNTVLLNKFYTLSGSFGASTGNWNGGKGFIPIGTSANPFTGSLLGQNNTISGVTINLPTTSNVGLFGYVSNGTVSGMTITGTVTGLSDVGLLAGQFSGTAADDFSTGTVTAKATNGGGLIGYLSGASTSLHNSNSGATVSAVTSAGGIAGEVDTGATVTNDYAYGPVSASTTEAGSLIGDINNGTVSFSYGSGQVTGGTDLGGLIGFYNTGSATLSNTFWDTQSTLISSTSQGCGNVSNCAGVTGIPTSSFLNQSTFSAWNITSTPSTTATPPSFNWFIVPGYTRPFLISEFNTSVNIPHRLQVMSTTLGASYSLANNISLASSLSNASDIWGGGSTGFSPIGTTTTAYSGTFSGNSHTISGLSFDAALTTGTGLFGAISSTGSVTNLTLSGVSITNTSTSGSTIALDVGALAGANAGTINNVTVSGTVSVTGNFVSNIGSIVGLNTGSITGSNQVYNSSTASVSSSGNSVSDIGGLAGQNSSTGSIVNSFYTGTVSSTGSSTTKIGGLTGDNAGSITESYSSGNVNANGPSPSDIGGLSGANEGSLSIVYSSSTIIASSTLGSVATNVGGLVGYENAAGANPIINTYATGSITIGSLITSNTGTNVGGLIGDEAAGPVQNSYSTGASTIDSVSTTGTVGGFIGVMGSSITNANNFYDTTTSGTSTSVGTVGSGSSAGVTQGCLSGTCPNGGTAIMNQPATFTAVGWDFTTVPVWGILAGYSYPYFTDLTLGVHVIDAVSGGVAPTPAAGGSTLTPVFSASSASDYYYLFSQSTINSTNPILFFNTAGSPANGLIYPSINGPNTTPITITLTANTIQVGGGNTGSMDSTNLGGDAAGGNNVLFNSGTNNLTLGNATTPNVTLQTASATTFTLGGGVSSFGTADNMIINGPLTINNGGAAISTSGTQTYNTTVTLQSDADFVTSSTSGSIAVNGNISGGTNNVIVNNLDSTSNIAGVYSGSGTLTKLGSGSLTLSNSNLYTGNTTLTNGILILNATGASPTPLGNTTSGTLQFAGGTLEAGSSLGGPVANPYTNSGIAFISTIGGSNNLTLSGTGTLNSGYTLNVINSAVTTLSGVLSGSGQLNEIGGTLDISNSGNSGYSGNVNISGSGTLQLGTATNATGTGTLALNGGNLQSLVANASLNEPFLSNGSSSINGSNSITLSGNNTIYSGTLDIAVTQPSNVVTLSGSLQSGAGGIQLDTPGTVIVSGTNNTAYSGKTTINTGTLEISSATNALGTGTGNSLALNGGTLLSTLTATLGNSFIVGGSGSASIGGTNNITMTGDGTMTNVLNVTNTAGTITLSGTLHNAAGSIVENGAGGTLVITGNNTYGTSGTTGTTVTAGTLIAKSSTALGAGNGVVASGAQLDVQSNGAGSLTIINPLSLNGTGVSGVGALVDTDTGTGNTVSGAITLAGAATIGVANSSETLTLGGAVTNAGFALTYNASQSTSAITENGVISGLGGLNNVGAGTTTLSATNLFSGSNSFTAGKVIDSNAQGLGVSNTTTVGASAITEIAGVTTVATEAMTLNGGTLEGTKTAAQPTFSGNITLTQNSSDTISTLNAVDTFKLSGTINGTSGVGTNGDLTFGGPGTINPAGMIGATTAINSLTDNATLSLSAGTTSIKSVGNQTYNGTVAIAAATTTLTTTGSGSVSITNTFGTAAKNLTINTNGSPGGTISESGSGKINLTTGTLTISSIGGTTLNGANTFTTFNATNTTSGNIALTNTIGTLTVSGISENGGGNVTISNTGGLTVSGAETSNGGTVGLTASGAMAINSTITAGAGSVNLTATGASGAISGTGSISSSGTLTTSSVTGTSLIHANTVSTFNATNSGTGAVSFINTAAPLAVTGITQSGTGAVSVTNSGSINVTGNVSAGANNVTIKASSAGNTLTLNSNVSIASTGTVNLQADNMSIPGSASIGGSGAGVILQPLSAETIGVNGGTGILQLTSTILGTINAATLHIGNSTAGNINLAAWTPSGNVVLNGVLTLDSAGTITQSGALNLTSNNAGLILRDASGVTLTNVSNSFGNIAASISGSVNLINSGSSVLNVTALNDILPVSSVSGITAPGGVTMQSTASGISLTDGIVSSGSSSNIILAATTFQNNAGSTALQPGSSGRFLVYSQDTNTANYSSQRGGLTYQFKQYNLAYPSAPAQSTGNGFIYTIAPVITPELTTPTVSKVYDGTTTATLVAANYLSSGIIDGDTITLNDPTSGNYDTAQVGTNKNVTATGITLNAASNGSAVVYGYQLGSSTASNTIGTIYSSALTITGFQSQNKIYDTTTTATVVAPGAITSGEVVAGDQVTLLTTNVVANFSQTTVGNNLTVTGSGYQLTGAQASNYTLTNPTVLENITPAPVTANNVTANNKVYDGTTSATLNTSSSTLSGVYAIDQSNVSIAAGATGTFATQNVGTNIVVTATTVNLTGSAAFNYYVNPLPSGLTANITAATLTYVANTASRAYGAANPAFAGNVTGFVPGDNIGNATTGTLTFSTTAGNTSNVGSYAINGSGLTANNGNYVFVQSSNNATALTITKANITLSGSRNYNGTTSISASSFGTGGTINTGVNGETLVVSGAGSVTNANATAGEALTIAGLSLTNGTGLASNYSIAASGDTTAITPAPLSLSTSNVVRTYNGTDSASGTAIVSSGTLYVNASNGNTQDSISGGTFAFTDPNAGSGNKSVTVSNVTVNDGNSGNNYAVSYVTNTTSTINPAPISINAVSGTRVYNGTSTSSATPTISGTLYNNTLSGQDTITGLSQAYTSPNVLGANNSSLAVTGYTVNDGNGGNNYSVTTNTAAGTITPAPLTFNATTNTRIYNGTTASSLTPTVSGTLYVNSVSGQDTVTGLTQSFNSPNVLGAGGSTLRVSGYTVNDGNSGNNYSITTNTATGTITPASLSVNAAADTKTYNGTTTSSQTPVVSGTLYVNSASGQDSVTNLNQAFSSPNALGSGGSTLNVTGYSVNDGNSGNNYTVTTHTSSGTINPASLTISAAADNRQYNGTDSSSVTPTITGTLYVNSVSGQDSVNNLAQTYNNPNVLGAGNSTLSVSGYTVNDGNSGHNYSITTQTTASTITPAPLSVNAVTDNRVYDGTDTSAQTPAIVGTLYNNVVSGQDSVSGTVQAFSSPNVLGAGNSTLGVTAYVVNDGNSGNNYTVTTHTSSASITPAPLTLESVTDSRTYNGTESSSQTPVIVGTLYNNVVSGQDTVTNLGQTFASPNALGINNSTLAVSTYTVNDGNSGNNYSITTSNASGSINPAPLTINAAADNRVYNGSDSSSQTPVIVGTLYNNVVSGQDTVTGLSQAYSNPNVEGANNSTVGVTGYTVNDGNSGGNYSVTTNTTAATISPAPLSIDAVTDNRTYNGSDTSTQTPVIVGTLYNNVVSGQDTVSNLTQSFNNPNVAGANNSGIAVSNYTVNDGNSGNNYSVTLNINSGTINPAPLTIDSVSSSKTYNGSDNSTQTPTVVGTLYNNVISGQDTVTNLAQAYTNPNVAGANNSTIGVSAYTVNDGNSGSNYAVSTGTATGTINPAPLTISAQPDTKTYNGTDSSSVTPVVIGTLYNNVVSGQDTVTGLAQTYNSPNVQGTNNSIIGVAGYTVNDGNGGNNYSVTTSTSSGTINPLALNVVGLTANNKIANNNTQATLNFTYATLPGVIGGDDVGLNQINYSANFISGSPGTNISVIINYLELNGSSAGNYSLIYPTYVTGDIFGQNVSPNLPPPYNVIFSILYNPLYQPNLQPVVDEVMAGSACHNLNKIIRICPRDWFENPTASHAVIVNKMRGHTDEINVSAKNGQ